MNRWFPVEQFYEVERTNSIIAFSGVKSDNYLNVVIVLAALSGLLRG